MTHTPGPWTARPRNDGEGYSIRAPNETHHVAVVVAGGLTNRSYRSKEVQSANARLIAAAPDLLEALKLIPTGDLDP